MSHKKFEYELPDGYIPMLLGAVNKKLPAHYVSDALGENISSKNANYCELTGLYEIWKNKKEPYVGLAHYRRYFASTNYCSRFFLYLLIILKGNLELEPVSEMELKRYIREYDWVIPTNEVQMGRNLWEHYGKHHNIGDIKKTRTIISKIYPDYLTTFDRVMYGSNKMSTFNMFYTRREQLDRYCKWLFDILFELEKQVDVSDYDSFQKRIFGFISEELFNVWIKKNSQLKIKYLSVFNTHLLTRKDVLLRFKDRGRVK